MKSFLVAAVSLLLIVFIACTKKNENAVDGNCDSGIITLSTDSIIGPTTVQSGTKVAFYVAFTMYSGCGKYVALEETTSGNTITLTVKGQYLGCACTQNINHGQAPYAFGAAGAGTYTIQVLQPSGPPQVHTFTVQ